MGEIADAILNGDMTEDCEWIGGGMGYPRSAGGYQDEPCARKGKPRHQTPKGSPPPSRKQPPAFKPEHAALGFRVCSPWHWQAMTPAGRLNWWPSARKWQLGERITEGDEQALRAFLAGLAAFSDIQPPGGRFPSPSDVHAAQTAPGGWPREQLAAWGVPWPPPKGWRKRLAAGYALQQREKGNG